MGDEPFAELAWPDLETPTALLAGDQRCFAEKWQNAGWRVITDTHLSARGASWLAEQL